MLRRGPRRSVRSGAAHCLSLLALLACPAPAAADGMYAPLTGETVANTADEQALLIFGPDWTRLVLRTGYLGNGKPFAWIIPTLGLLHADDVTTADSLLFRTLDDLTAPQLVEYATGCGASTYGCAEQGADDDGETSRPVGVTVFQSFDVAEFHVDVVGAGESGALAAWFTRQGYNLPESGAAVLDRYVSEGFHFVAVRVEPAAPSTGEGGDPPDGGAQGEGEGGATPLPVRALAFRFPGVMDTFPLRISALSTTREVELLLHVIGRGRYRVAPADFETVALELPVGYEGDNFEAYYAGRLAATVRRPSGRPAFAVEYAGPLARPVEQALAEAGLLQDAAADGETLFVTRLRTLLRPEQMDRDVRLEPEVGEASLRQHRVRVVTQPRADSGLAALLPFDGLLVLVLAGLARLRARGRRR